jgi:hypothetical protein
MAATMCDTQNCDDEIWETTAPQTEQCRDVGAIEDPEFSFVDTKNLTSDQIQYDIDDSVASPQAIHYQLSSHAQIESKIILFWSVVLTKSKENTRPSMVSSKTLSHLDLTSQEIFENNKLFGGVSALAVDDLLQLQLVGEKPVFSNEGKGYEALAQFDV